MGLNRVLSVPDSDPIRLSDVKTVRRSPIRGFAAAFESLPGATFAATSKAKSGTPSQTLASAVTPVHGIPKFFFL